MRYTKEQIETIKNNIKKIEEYCKKEILPQTPDGISIIFYEIQSRSDGSTFRKTYGFRVERDGTPTFTSSALRIVLDEKYEGGSTSVNAYEDWQYTIELFERWQTVKSKLQEEIHKQRAKKSAVLDFQI